MNKGRIITKAILTRLSLSAAAMLLCAPVVYAQQGNPEVYVDMGALQGIGNAPASSAPIKLRPPVPKPASAQGFTPRLTAPMAAVPVSPPPPPSPPPRKQAAPVSAQPVTPVITPAHKPAAPALAVPPEAKKHAEPAKPLSVPQAIKPATVSKSPDMPPDKLPLKSAPPPPPVPAPPPASSPVPAPVPEAAPAAPVPTVFPVETRVRTETNDPTDSEASRPVPVRSGVAGSLQDMVVPSRPLPDMDPSSRATTVVKVKQKAEEPKTAAGEMPPLVPARKPQNEPQDATGKVAAAPKVRIDAVRDEPQAEIAAVKAPPPPDVKPATPVNAKTPPLVPGRRPDFVEKAPDELVAELRAREAARAIEESAPANGSDAAPKRKIDLNDPPPPPGPRGKKNMPSVKKTAVESEAIAEQVVKLPAQNDPLLDSLVEKDKDSLVATIESMVAAREEGKSPPAAAKQRRTQGTNIVKAEPMQRPYNVYRPEKKDEGETKIASLPPAAEESAPIVTESPASKSKFSGPRPPPPQAQDEQAYVSVPFTEGLTEIDTKITGEIEKRILPILNKNPAWKLQIQAFASPVKDGASSARKASLARALSVRTYLLGKGIDATRMDVRALGAESDRDPMDRVDLIVFDPATRS